MRPANENMILDACRAAAAEIRTAAMHQGLELDDEDRRGLFALAALIERKTEPRAMCRDIIDRAVSGMIDLLNALDAPNEDLEPSLGAPERHGSAAWGFGVNWAIGSDQTFWACGGDTDEREDENEHGTELDRGEVDDCPRPARTAKILELRRPVHA